MTEPKKDLPGETPAEPKPQEGAVQEPPKTETVAEEFNQERAMKTITALREEVKEAKKLQRRLDELEAVEAKRKESEMSEMDKLQKRIADYEAKLAAATRSALLRKVSDEAGLPAELSARLIGESEDDLKADAKKLMELIKAPPKPRIEPTLPTDGQRPETDEEKRKRILNPGSYNPFSIDGAKKLGGGVINTEK